MIKKTQRVAEVSMNTELEEYTKRSFYRRMRKEDFADSEIHQKWASATSTARYQTGLAEMRGKVEWIWWPVPRRRQHRDVLRTTLSTPGDKMTMGQKSAEDMLQGAHAPGSGALAPKHLRGALILSFTRTIVLLN